MKIVVDINHPAHVHYFKNFIRIMKERGHELLVTASEKDVSFKLLDLYNIKYINLGHYGNSNVKKLFSIPLMDLKYLLAIKNFKPDIFLGFGSIRASHIAFLLNKQCINFEDTEHSMEQILLYKPFVKSICTPTFFRLDLGRKQIKFNGFMELAALHPKYFSPNPAVLTELGLNVEDNIILIRFASFNATHDSRSEHFDVQYIPDLINKLKDKGKIIISTEVELDSSLKKYQYKLSPDKYHDLLYYSKIYIGESSTSAMEAAVLGTPSINFEKIIINRKEHSTAEIFGVIAEYQNNYNLLLSYYDEVKMLEKIDEILKLGLDKYKKQLYKNRERLLEDTIDVTEFMIWFVENYPNSINLMDQE